MNDEKALKQRAASISIFSNLTLIIAKTTAGLVTGSVSVMSEAVHSTVDLAAAVIAWFAVRLSGKDPDENHPYGHGKIENISGTIEALLILAAAGGIIWGAAHKLIHGTLVEKPGLALGVMLLSGTVNIFVSRYLHRIARRTHSLALEADATHLRTDVYSSLGIFAGLLLVTISGIHALDPIIAILMALFITIEGVLILRRSFGGLLDTSLSGTELAEVETVLNRHAQDFTHVRNLRSRQVGSSRKIDFILEFCSLTSLAEAHAVCDRLESEINRVLPGSEVFIHPEPCSQSGPDGICRATRRGAPQCRILRITETVFTELFAERASLAGMSMARRGLRLEIQLRIRGTIEEGTLTERLREQLGIDNLVLDIHQL